jgi:hypothetical protein
MAALARCLDNMQQRVPWYPGSGPRLAAFKQRFPGAQALGRPTGEVGQQAGHVAAEPWMLASGAWCVCGGGGTRWCWVCVYPLPCKA